MVIKPAVASKPAPTTKPVAQAAKPAPAAKPSPSAAVQAKAPEPKPAAETKPALTAKATEAKPIETKASEAKPVVVKPVAVFLRIATELDYQDRVPSSSVRRFRNVFGAMKSFLDDGEAMGAHPTTWYVFDCDAVDAEFQLIELNRWGSIEEALEKRKRYGLVDDLAEAWDGIRATPVTCGKDSVW